MKKQKLKKEDKQYWRSIDQLTETEAEREATRPEFPEGADQPPDNAWSRRSFMTTIAAGLALAGLSGCRRPVEKIVPYVSRPEGFDPGTPHTYATTCVIGGDAVGILVRSNDGRPTHIEGNPLHPSSGGPVTPQIQASLLDLYDPDRTRTVLNDGTESSYDSFALKWAELYQQFKGNSGRGLAILCEPFASPSMTRLKNRFKKTFPRAEFVSYAPVSDENIIFGLEQVLGQPARPIYNLSRARTILALDSDFLSGESDSIRNTGEFSEGRQVKNRDDQMNRLYVAESSFTVTGTMADHRLQVAGSQVAAFTLAVAREIANLGVKIDGLGSLAAMAASSDNQFDSTWIQAVAEDLVKNSGRAIVLAGRRQPAAIHALVYQINKALSANGPIVNYYQGVNRSESSSADLKRLIEQMNSGSVTTLVMLGGNPVYNAPADSDFSKALELVKTSVHLSLHNDETSRLVNWHIPMTHYLEAWGDAESVDGTLSVVQPLVAPLFNGQSELELLSLVTDGAAQSGYETVRSTWSEMISQSQFKTQWQRTLHDGIYSASLDSAKISLPKRRSNISLASNWPVGSDGSSLEIQFIHSQMFDGRFANNGWLQELPDPITKTVWNNGIQIAPALAERLSIADGDFVDVSAGGRTLEAQAVIVPGHADNCATIPLGYGRQMGGRIADDVGCNGYQLKDSGWFLTDATITSTGRSQELSTTQKHSRMEGRPLIRENSLADYKKTGEFYPEQTAHPPLVPLWDSHKYDKGNQWGMTVDLNACTGCGACSVACQSENNIPIVGSDQVNRGREMQWIRVDRYFAGDLNDPEVVHQPVMCQHCENAPCESVCPVVATVHDAEGLNVMVYNRCIGTRYCSNNCPYKVRRFNFFNFTKDTPEIQKMGKNPEVTIRSRGVMEKCTYCIQRISKAKTSAKADGREMKDGEVVVACQSACPTKAINFGNVIDPDSKVSQMKRLDRNYAVLEELHCIPRTTYLAKLRNPNPKLADRKQIHAEGGNG